MLLVKHIHLLYYNFVKFQERSKLLNNERRFFVAETWTSLILIEWVLIVFITFYHFFEDFLDSHELVVYGIFFVIFLSIYFLSKVFKRTLINLNDEYDQIRNWKQSSYRKTALAFTLFYFILFPFFLVFYINFLIILF